MIVISSSLPKSGSTLVANLQEDLLAMCEPENGQGAFREAFGGRFVEEITPWVAAKLMAIHEKWGSMVVKTHCRVTWSVRALVVSGVARATYCFRDPRDVILSAMDHCRRDKE